jgi:hypothetical protein
MNNQLAKASSFPEAITIQNGFPLSKRLGPDVFQVLDFFFQILEYVCLHSVICTYHLKWKLWAKHCLFY